MGTPSFAVPSLEAVAGRCDVVGVVTQPDRPRGRGRAVGESEVARAAAALGLPVIKTAAARDDTLRERLVALRPDLFAVVAFGAILTPALLAVPRLGSINLHGSLLPDYRGASPVHGALWDGLAGTGVTTLWMDEGIDTGDLILQRWVAIEPGDDAGVLAARLAATGAPLLAESLRLAHAEQAPRRPQDRKAGGYARKLAKADGAIEWALDAVTVWHRQRAVTPWPGATTAWRDRPIQILKSRPEHRLVVGEPGTVVAAAAEGIVVACRPGALRLLEVKPEGRDAMPAADWARGARVEPGGAFALETRKETHT